MSSPEKPEYVLFATPNCKFCNNFINKLKAKPDLLKKFNVVDIDKLQVIPDEIDEVPSVYDGKQIFKGAEAFSWLNDKLVDFLSPADDGLQYSFIDGQEEKVFGNYSLLEQKNGSFGMGESPAPSAAPDPTRMGVSNDNTNKNRTMDSIMASRSLDLK
jgi:hypothetical protein